ISAFIINVFAYTAAGATSCPPIIGGASEALSKLVGVEPLGHACGSDSLFHYYVCCGKASADCCFRLQTWVIVSVAVCAAIILTSVVLSLIRCVFCRR
uniref:Secreted protein n=1 Tax=Syphacia muris TaxID=451379 RepID=A0A0N5AS77_9BILA